MTDSIRCSNRRALYKNKQPTIEEFIECLRSRYRDDPELKRRFPNGFRPMRNFGVISFDIEQDCFTEFAFSDSVQSGPPLSCPKCGQSISTIERYAPFEIELETWGAGYGDIAKGPGNGILCSKRFLDAINHASFRGIREYHPVVVKKCIRHKKIVGPIPEYCFVKINHFPTRIDPEISVFKWRNPDGCPVCLNRGTMAYENVTIDEATWNGDDIFYALGFWGSVIVSDRLYEWTKIHKFANLKIVDLKSLKEDFYPWLSRKS